MKKLLASALIGALALGASAGAMADEASVKAALLGKYKSLSPNTPVKATEVKGIYEVNLQGKAAYTNETVDYLFVGGSLINAATLEDVTAKRQPEFLKGFFASLPLESAVKRVYGKGERVIVSFEDPDCPLCQKQAKIFEANAERLNATVYSFLFPLESLHPDALRKANFIVCSPKPDEVFHQWMSKQTGLPLSPAANGRMTLHPSAKTQCADTKKVQAGIQLARNLNYNSTPRFIFENGWGAKGYLEIEELQAAFKSVAADLKKAPRKPDPKAK